MIRTFNELKSLVKHISCDGKCKFDKKYIVQSKSRININIGMSVKKLIKQHVCKGNCIRSPSIKACQ